jgi:hypothetical protein
MTPEEIAHIARELYRRVDDEIISGVAVGLIYEAIREAQASARDDALEEARDSLSQLAIHLEHAMDSLTDAERTPSVIGGYVRDWAANSLKSKG